MKKLAFAAITAAAMASTPAMADTTVIYATIAPVCTIDGPANNGTVNLSGVTALGNVTAECNNAAGFTASVASQNGFELIDQTNGSNSNTYPYTLDVAGVGGPISSNQSVNSSVLGGNGVLLTPRSAAVSVTTSGPSGQAFAGTYQDTLTWTITAN